MRTLIEKIIRPAFADLLRIINYCHLFYYGICDASERSDRSERIDMIKVLSFATILQPATAPESAYYGL